MKKMSEMVNISVGKGTILVPESDLLSVKGNFILLESFSEKGPCNDDWCQLQKSVIVGVKNMLSPSGRIIVRSGNISIAMDIDIYNSIDRGRQTVVLRTNMHGNLVLKGFSFTD